MHVSAGSNKPFLSQKNKEFFLSMSALGTVFSGIEIVVQHVQCRLWPARV